MANVHTVDLVNRILPNVGDTISVEDYRAKLEELGYDTRHQVGSLGGASNSGVIEIKDGMVTISKINMCLRTNLECPENGQEWRII